MAERQLWTRWVTAALILLALYGASFGPACWLIHDSKSAIMFDMTADLYRPLIRMANAAPVPVRNSIAAFSGKGRHGFPTMLDCLTALLDHKLMWL